MASFMLRFGGLEVGPFLVEVTFGGDDILLGWRFGRTRCWVAGVDDFASDGNGKIEAGDAAERQVNGDGLRVQKEESIAGSGHYWRQLWCREVDHPKSVLSAVTGEDGAVVAFDVDVVLGESDFEAMVAD
jgi:hypothetical protein